MAIVQMNVPLADVLIETGLGIHHMNTALAANNVGATSATVKFLFVASFQEGFDYKDHSHSAGGAFTFWFIGGAAAGWYRNTELHLYRNYAEYIRMEVEVNFELLPAVQAAPAGP
ncbi:MAG: hypothetical protein KJ065_25430 [Anaerolineae bacterium]|nr:hypothetical protein [Anaerolineae bacterium]